MSEITDTNAAEHPDGSLVQVQATSEAKKRPWDSESPGDGGESEPNVWSATAGDKHSPRRGVVSRRGFLRGAIGGGATVLLAACGVATPATPQADLAPFVPWHPLLPSPQPAGAAEATPRPDSIGLEAFLALSAVLTGIDGLNPQVGQIYLDSLASSSEFEVSLADLYQQAGFTAGAVPTIEDVEQAGIFESEGTRALADKIVEYWYSGVYDTPDGEQAVATFADALVWRAVKYTKPLTICAAPGFWAVAPQ